MHVTTLASKPLLRADARNRLVEQWLPVSLTSAPLSLQVSSALRAKSKNFTEATNSNCGRVAQIGADRRRHNSEEAG